MGHKWGKRDTSEAQVGHTWGTSGANPLNLATIRWDKWGDADQFNQKSKWGKSEEVDSSARNVDVP